MGNPVIKIHKKMELPFLIKTPLCTFICIFEHFGCIFSNNINNHPKYQTMSLVYILSPVLETSLRSSARASLSPCSTLSIRLRFRCTVHLCRGTFGNGSLTAVSSPLRPSATIMPILSTPHSRMHQSTSAHPVALSPGLLYMPSTSLLLSSSTPITT